MCRLTDRTVRSTLVTAWFFAGWPTSTSPFLAKATMDGVVREPSELAITVGSPPSRTATTELVVPRSIPTARAIWFPPAFCSCGGLSGSHSSLPAGWITRQTELEPLALNLSDWPNERAAGCVPLDRPQCDIAAVGPQADLRTRGVAAQVVGDVVHAVGLDVDLVLVV